MVALKKGKVITDMKNKCKRKKWRVSQNIIENWSAKTCQILMLYKTDSLAKFKLEEIMHYVSIKDLRECKVETQKDETVLKELFKQNQLESPKSNNTALQLPEETFMQHIKGVTCPKCRSCENTITYSLQTRSADEPTDYFGECSGSEKKRCSYTWKIKK